MSAEGINDAPLPAVLVTDGEQRSALAVTRALGRRGYPVFVCASRPRSLAGASRFALEQRAIPSSLRDPDGFTAAVRELIREWRIGALLPMTEQAMLALLAVRDELDVLLPFPPLERFRRISDKAELLRVAADLGIRVPEQVTLHSPDDRSAIRPDDLRYPLVLKPGRSVAENGTGRHKLGVRYAMDASGLAAALDTLPPSAYPLLLQQRIVGPGIGIFLLLWKGEFVATFAHRRLREKPPSGGVSVYRESIEPPPNIVERSRALLERFDWEGVAMIEYKLDAATGTPFLMEVNGRFWGSLQLALDAGVDFPSLLLSRARGGRERGPARWRTGVRSRWEWGEIDHLLARLRRGPRELALPPDAPSRTRTMLQLLCPWRPGDRLEILRASDPGPFVRETVDWLRRHSP